MCALITIYDNTLVYVHTSVYFLTTCAETVIIYYHHPREQDHDNSAASY